MNPIDAPLVLISPAMAVPGRYYRPLVEAFAHEGWAATTVDRRGIGDHAKSPSRANDWSYADEADDLGAAVARARADDPSRPVLVLGHSLGAQLCAVLGTRGDDMCPDAVVTVAASVPWFRHYPRGGIVEFGTATAVPIVTAAIGHWPTPGFGAPAPRTLMREWARMVRTGRAPFDGDDLIGIPILAVRLAEDRLVTSPAAELFERRFDPEVRTTWTYTADECPPGGSVGHVQWVRTPGPIVDRTIRWWSDQGRARSASFRERRSVSTTAYPTPSTASPIIEA